MSSEQEEIGPPNSSDETAQALGVPRWAIVAVLVILSLPLLIMSSMIFVMGWFGPPMHGGMMNPNLGVFRIVGFIPLLLLLGMIYGVYRLSAANKN